MQNAQLGMIFGPPRPGDARLGVKSIRPGLDGVFFRPKGDEQFKVIDRIQTRKHVARHGTAARRLEVVARAHEAAAALGWELTAEERAMLAAF